MARPKKGFDRSAHKGCNVIDRIKRPQDFPVACGFAKCDGPCPMKPKE